MTSELLFFCLCCSDWVTTPGEGEEGGFDADFGEGEGDGGFGEGEGGFGEDGGFGSTENDTAEDDEQVGSLVMEMDCKEASSADSVHHTAPRPARKPRRDARNGWFR